MSRRLAEQCAADQEGAPKEERPVTLELNEVQELYAAGAAELAPGQRRFATLAIPWQGDACSGPVPPGESLTA